MKEINIYCGTTITEACNKLIAKGEGYYLIFNGVKIRFIEGYSQDDYKKYFLEQLEESNFQETVDVNNMQKDIDNIKSLVAIISNFNHNRELPYYLEWLISYIRYADLTYVSHFRITKNVLLSLKKKGFIQNGLVGDKTIKGNKDKELRWIIGQIMDGLTSECIHPILADKLEKWLEKYYPNKDLKEK